MGWGYCGTDEQGRDIGYEVAAACDREACGKEIHRGLDYVCGDMHGGGTWGCGRYFCHRHLEMTFAGQLCIDCATTYWEANEQEDE